MNNYAANSTVTFKFTTVNSVGAPTTLSGTPIVSIYKGSNLVQTTTGVTLSVDFDGIVGANNLSIVTTDAFYATGNDYQAVITTGTVSGANVVGYIVGEFSIENRFQEVDIVKLGGVVQSATDLKDFADAGYDPATNKVQGVVLCDTNTDMRGTDSALTDKTGFSLSATGLNLIVETTTGAIEIAKAFLNRLNVLNTTANSVGASIAQIDTIGSGGSGALPFEILGDNTGAAIKGAVFSGTEASGTFLTTQTQPNVYHNITDATLIDIVYRTNIGGSKQAVEISLIGFLNSSNDTCTVQLYDFVGTSWETLATLQGQNQTTNINASVIALNRHTGTGVDLGEVLIRFICSSTSPSLNVGTLFVNAQTVINSAGYAGMISVNTVGGGTNGSNPQVNGTIDNPVITMTEVNSLLTAKNFTRIDVQATSTLAFTSSQLSQVFTGFNWTLALGNQNITGSFFLNAIVSGIGTSTTGTVRFDNCRFNTCTLPPVMAKQCGFLSDAVMTAGSGGTYTFYQGHNMDTFTGSLIFDFNRAVNTATPVKMQWKPGSGSVTIKNMKSSDELSIYGFARVILDSSNTQGGSINIDNSTLIDNVIGGFTGSIVIGDLLTKLISLDTTKIPDIISLVNINGEVDTALNTAIPGSPTANSINERVKAIDDKLPTGTISDFNETTDTVVNVTNLATNNDKTGYTISGAKTTLDSLNDITAASVWASTTRTLTAFSTALSLSIWNVLLTAILTSGSIGLRLKQLLGLTITGTVDTTTASATVVIFETDILETTIDHFKDRLLTFTSGALSGEQTDITGYTFSINNKGQFTVTGLTDVPVNGTTFEIT